ncbi:type II secretion system protein [Photobacterium leiognathi]|uniref:type II secretion system protein n=1 Tax=Photobacterium leiognathi TaxID=553611 RepID=UPI002980CB6A|nr:prepilin-type N-terminal cleavage/methylation domain-containing protein [Photobacterium leiognathi]
MNISKLKVKNKQKGFTLIELLIVLVVIAILAIVGLLVKPKVIAQLDTYKLNSALDVMVAQAPVWRGGKYTYNDISVKGMCEQQLLPFEVCGATNDGLGANPFGGDYVIKSSRAYGNQHFNIEVTKINSDSVGLVENSMLYRSIERCTSIKGCGSFGKVEASGRDGKTTSIDIDV